VGNRWGIIGFDDKVERFFECLSQKQWSARNWIILENTSLQASNNNGTYKWWHNNYYVPKSKEYS